MKEFTLCLLSNESISKFPNNKLSKFLNYLPKPLLLEPQKWEVGLSEIFINTFLPNVHKQHLLVPASSSPSKESEEEILKKYCTTEFLYVYCNIIPPRTIGSQQAKVLKVIPTLSFPEKHIVMQNIEYFPVHDEIIQTISIKITDQEGSQIIFSDSVLPTMIILKFRKIE